MTALTIIGVTLLVIMLAIFVGHMLGFGTDVPRVDYCNDEECVQSGRCQTGECK